MTRATTRREPAIVSDVSNTVISDPARRTRLTPEREAELFRKVLDLLVEEGYDNLTMDTIAARTHSSKATLYRQWQSKPRLVATTLRYCKQMDQESIDTGSLCGDLRALARRIGSGQGHEMAGVFWSMVDTIRRNPELREALNEVMLEPGKQAIEVILQRAVDRGEISHDAPGADFIQCMIVGAILSHSVTEGREADSDYMLRYFDAVVLPALGLTAPNDRVATRPVPTRRTSPTVLRPGPTLGPQTK